jgi:hypothetical protein
MFKKFIFPSLFIMSILMAGCQQAATNSPQGTAATQQKSGTQATSSTQASAVSSAKIFLAAVGDNGKSGKLIGCGDSLVSVDTKIAPASSTESKITEALQALFKIRTQNYGQSGLYNALYQSTLTVDRVGIGMGKATVMLIGETKLGGECDDPRFVEQITQTVMQFPEVKEADITVNGKPLKDLLSLKG